VDRPGQLHGDVLEAQIELGGPDLGGDDLAGSQCRQEVLHRARAGILTAQRGRLVDGEAVLPGGDVHLGVGAGGQGAAHGEPRGGPALGRARQGRRGLVHEVAETGAGCCGIAHGSIVAIPGQRSRNEPKCPNIQDGAGVCCASRTSGSAQVPVGSVFVKILLIGSGAREHALARSLATDPATSELIVAPGNPGTAHIATNVAVDASNPAAVTALAREHDADLVVIGPEAPLVAGVADAVRAADIPVFGPNADAAHLEGSKAFAKEIMAAANVPTAMARVCRTTDEV